MSLEVGSAATAAEKGRAIGLEITSRAQWRVPARARDLSLLTARVGKSAAIRRRRQVLRLILSSLIVPLLACSLDVLAIPHVLLQEVSRRIRSIVLSFGLLHAALFIEDLTRLYINTQFVALLSTCLVPAASCRILGEMRLDITVQTGLLDSVTT